MDANAILTTAQNFNNAAKVLFEEMKKNQDPNLAAPYFVNMSFALELYLKSLYFFEHKKQCRGHSLYLIYDKLNKDSKEEIKAIYTALASMDPVLKIMKFEAFKDGRRDFRYDFDTVLKTASNTFVEFRYHFEKPPSDVIGMELIIHAVEHRIKNVKDVGADNL